MTSSRSVYSGHCASCCGRRRGSGTGSKERGTGPNGKRSVRRRRGHRLDAKNRHETTRFLSQDGRTRALRATHKRTVFAIVSLSGSSRDRRVFRYARFKYTSTFQRFLPRRCAPKTPRSRTTLVATARARPRDVVQTSIGELTASHTVRDDESVSRDSLVNPKTKNQDVFTAS